MNSPGAATSTHVPVLLKPASVSDAVLAATATTPAMDAGATGTSAQPSLPAAATTSTPRAWA